MRASGRCALAKNLDLPWEYLLSGIYGPVEFAGLAVFWKLSTLGQLKKPFKS